MKAFELTLVHRRDKEFEMDKVDGDDLVELLAKFLLIIATVQRRLANERPSDDDIPF